MKKKISVYLTVLMASLGLLFVLGAVFGISVGIAGAPTNETQEKVPYYVSEAPDEYGILVNFDSGGSVFLGFDALSHKTAVIFLENSATKDEVTRFGYEVDDTAKVTYDFLAEFIDRFGGIELQTEEGRLKYTGVQITEMLSKTYDRELRREITERLLENVNKQGITGNDAVFIIENTETTLNYPKSYYLPETILRALNNVFFVN